MDSARRKQGLQYSKVRLLSSLLQTGTTDTAIPAFYKREERGIRANPTLSKEAHFIQCFTSQEHMFGRSTRRPDAPGSYMQAREGRSTGEEGSYTRYAHFTVLYRPVLRARSGPRPIYRLDHACSVLQPRITWKTSKYGNIISGAVRAAFYKRFRSRPGGPGNYQQARAQRDRAPEFYKLRSFPSFLQPRTTC